MSNLRITELDFDEIKSNLKAFLQDQEQFSDYDFEGSGLSILLDILAYNTHYNAYLANMLVNEMFLDSAVKRSSAVSIAKHLGYTPRSVRGSRATVDIQVTPISSPASLTLDRFTPFSTSINGVGYTFLNLDPITIEPSDGEYIFNNVEIVQGIPLSYTYTVSTTGPAVKYEIPNTGVDTTTIKVTVQASSSNVSTETYLLASDVSTLTNTSSVFFLEETTTDTYNLFFGDDVLGKKLSAGNIITIEYLVSEGEATNVSSTISQAFTSDNNIGGSSDITVTTVSNPQGGASKETLESIKFNAPRHNKTNNRAVTIEDFKSIILSNLTQIQSVSVWGGESNNPPAYGKVFISLKPFSGTIVTPTLKNYIINDLLKPIQVATITTEIVDPDYTYVNLSIVFKYNKAITTKSSSTLTNLVRSTVSNYFSVNLQKFSASFYYFELLKKIREVDNAIVSVLTDINLQKRIVPALNVINTFSGTNSIKFGNSIEPGTIQTTSFYIFNNGSSTLVRMSDLPDTMPPNKSGTGSVNVYDISTGSTISNVGGINYQTGEITIGGLLPVALPQTQFDIRITGKAQNLDVSVENNQILLLDDSTYSLSNYRLPGLDIEVEAI